MVLLLKVLTMPLPKFAVLFDMDGVIVDSNPAHKIAIQTFCKTHKLKVTAAFLKRKVYGRTNNEWLPEVFGRLLSAKELKTYADEKETLFREIFAPNLVPVNGVMTLIESLKAAGVKIALATSAPLKNADFILDGLYIKGHFDALLTCKDVDKGKPHPQVYMKAAEALGMPPERCIVIEDSLSGVEAGIAAGCKVVGVTTTHTAMELSACNLVVDNFLHMDVKDLADLLEAPIANGKLKV
jgi:HAD superfamily hydrolase (TIGR01509 family)